MVVFTDVKKEDLTKLKGYSSEEIKSVYEEMRLRKADVLLVLYNSGKLLLQGKDVSAVVGELKKAGIGVELQPVKFRAEKGVLIGSDESLKGDTFGGLVVAAVKADEAMRSKLRSLGVADSKKLADKEILVMAERIKKMAECVVLNVFPKDYNGQKVTQLMNKLHREAYDYLRPGKHVVDKYPGCRVGEIAEEKAEDKYVEVAAASVLARAAALKQLDTLSMKAGFHLPRGSTHVKLALQTLKEKGLDFNKFVKIDFKNVKPFL